MILMLYIMSKEIGYSGLPLFKGMILIKYICMYFEHFVNQIRKKNKNFLSVLFLFGIQCFHTNINAKKINQLLHFFQF